MAYKRGEIYRVNLNPTLGAEQQGDARPCLVLSIDILNSHSNTVLMLPLTSSPRPLYPFIVSTPSAGKITSSVLCSQVRAIDKRRVKSNKLGELSLKDLQEVEKAVKFIAGL